MKICNKANKFEHCKYCHHSKPHKEITKATKFLAKLHNGMHATICCNDMWCCHTGNGNTVRVICIDIES